ncbi:MAG: hypothetical protein AB7R55_06370 [Gemmatimonadales bacterium]
MNNAGVAIVAPLIEVDEKDLAFIIGADGDALAAELQPFGVRVSLIEPGNYRSDMSKNVLARVGDVDVEVKDSRYERQLRGFYEMIQGDDPSPEPDAVAEAALHALFDPNPKMRYMVVPAARQAEVTIRQAMIELVQLNQGQGFSYDREALVRMLDEALARVP